MMINQGSNFTGRSRENRTIINIIFIHVVGHQVEEKFHTIKFYIRMHRFQNSPDKKWKCFTGIIVL